jgi:DNA polymerase III sliding clamp (beta) subunit (PCNA family)
VPRRFTHELRLPRREFDAVVRRVAVVCGKPRAVTLVFDDGQLTVAARGEDGEACEKVPVAYEGEPHSITLNPDHLREGLRSAGGAEVRLKLAGPLQPVVLQGGTNDYAYLLMPMRPGPEQRP